MQEVTPLPTELSLAVDRLEKVSRLSARPEKLVPKGGNTRVAHRAKMVQKRIIRAHHAAEPFHQEPAPAFKKVMNARKNRSDKISAFNRRCTKTEVKAKDGKLGIEGFPGVYGATHPPFILKLERIANQGYTGAELRSIRAEKGCGSRKERENAQEWEAVLSDIPMPRGRPVCNSF